MNAARRTTFPGRDALVTSLVGVMLFFGLCASAGAVVVQLPGGGRAGITLRSGVNPASVPGSIASPGANGFSGTANLTYHNGPVVHSSKPYLVFWDPNNQLSSTTKNLFIRYFNDLPFDAGLSTNAYSVNRQFTDGSGYVSDTTSWNAATQVIPDSQAYPARDTTATGCADVAAGYPTCITNLQLAIEVNRLIGTNAIAGRGVSDNAPLTFVVTPPNVNICFGGSQANSTVCADNTFCAYHSSFSVGGPSSLFAAIPTLIDGGNSPVSGPKGCQADGNAALQLPNGDQIADVALKAVSHEHAETLTDPLGTGWYDTNGAGENGDKCNSINDNPAAFTPTLGNSASPTLYNQLIHGDQYYLQSEWSNGESTCKMQASGSSINSSLTVSGGVHPVGTSVTFDPSASTSTAGFTSQTVSFGDGTQAFNRITPGNPPTSVTHTFTTAGQYSVSTTLIDTHGVVGGSNQSVTVGSPPVASFTFSPNSPIPGASVSFDASASSDPDNGVTITSYAWDFGDGSTAAGVNPSHSYATAGPYTVKLTVTNSLGLSSSTTQPLTVSSPPSHSQALSGSAKGVAYSPNGNLVAVSVASPANSVQTFPVDSSGNLGASADSKPGGSNPLSLAFSPGGGLLAEISSADTTLRTFSVSASGVLTQASSAATGSAPSAVAYSPDGSLIAVSNQNDNTVQTFSVSASGVLASVGSVTVVGGPQSVAFSPNGRLLAVGGSAGNTVQVLSVASGGALAVVSSASTSALPYPVAFNPSGSLLAVSENSVDAVQVFSVGATGMLSASAVGSTHTANVPFDLAFSPGGATLAVASFNGNILQQFTVGATGGLGASPAGSVSTDGGTFRMAFSPKGDFVVMANALAKTVQTVGAPVVDQVTAPQGLITDGVGAPIAPLTLLAGAQGTTVSCTLANPCSWSFPGLPAGLTASTAQGGGATAVISGTPTKVATAAMNVTVSQGGSTVYTFPVTISDIEHLDSAGGIGNFPTGMVADTTNSRVYVAATKSNAVNAIDASVNPITASATNLGFTTGQLNYPVGLAFSNNTLFASNLLSASAAQISPPLSGSPHSDPLPGCSQPEGVAADSGYSDVWVACYGGGSPGKVSVMSTAGVAAGAPFSLAGGASLPSGVAPDGTAGHAVVADSASGRLYTVDSTHALTSVTLPAGATPANVAFANLSGSLFNYVADPGTGQFSVIRETTDTSPADVTDVALPAGTNPSQPYGIATNGSTLVVSDANNARALVYSLTSAAPYATLLYTIALPASTVPNGVAAMNVGTSNLAFIGNESGNSVTVVDPPSRQLRRHPGPGGTIPPVLGTTVGTPVGTAQSPAQAAKSGHSLAPVPSKVAKPTRRAATKHAVRRHARHRARHKRAAAQRRSRRHRGRR